MTDHGYTQAHVDSGLITIIDGVPHAKVRYLVEQATTCDIEWMLEEAGFAHMDRLCFWRMKADELDAEFCADVIKNGIKTPVEFVPRDLHTWSGDVELGNGHHRVILAYLLGHELIPVTQSWKESTRKRGPVVKNRK